MNEDAFLCDAVADETEAFGIIEEADLSFAQQFFLSGRSLLWYTDFDVFKFEFNFLSGIWRSGGKIAVFIKVSHHVIHRLILRLFAAFLLPFGLFLFVFLSFLFAFLLVPGLPHKFLNLIKGTE